MLTARGAVQDADESKLLVLAAHCPAVLQRRTWSVQQFTLEKLLYVGHNSRVLRAIDKVTGTTVALKVYKKQQLGDMERCAPPRSGIPAPTCALCMHVVHACAS